MYNWLKHYEIPVCIVTTKADKIPKSQMGQACQNDQDRRLDSIPAIRHVLFSSETGLGRDELWAVINETIEESTKKRKKVKKFRSNSRG